MTKINATPANRQALRAHAREALTAYSRLMTWLLVDPKGDLSIITEPQGQSAYVGALEVVATTGSFYKAHGDGAAVNPATGRPYSTQREYLTDLLGRVEYGRIFRTAASSIARQRSGSFDLYLWGQRAGQFDSVMQAEKAAKSAGEKRTFRFVDATSWQTV